MQRTFWKSFVTIPFPGLWGGSAICGLPSGPILISLSVCWLVLIQRRRFKRPFQKNGRQRLALHVRGVFVYRNKPRMNTDKHGYEQERGPAMAGSLQRELRRER